MHECPLRVGTASQSDGKRTVIPVHASFRFPDGDRGTMGLLWPSDEIIDVYEDQSESPS